MSWNFLQLIKINKESETFYRTCRQQKSAKVSRSYRVSYQNQINFNFSDNMVRVMYGNCTRMRFSC